MRRGLIVIAIGICAAVGCGLDVLGGLEPESLPMEGGVEGGDTPPGDSGPMVTPDAAADADADAAEAGIDAEVSRPDAGVVFVPSHIQPVYSLTAPSESLLTDSEIDTSTRTITKGGASAISPDITISNGVAIWSVGSFLLGTGAMLTVKGTLPLVIVASGDVEIRGYIAAWADNGIPGPGGAPPAMGPGKGTNGTKTGDDASGGGGAGHATAGGVGGARGAVTGGPAGVVTNAAGAALTGGSGGGHGGGFAGAMCTETRRGRGGAGGGAIQISAIGKILFTVGGGIDVGGGGGGGGCKNNGQDRYRGGGGGGAGGLVVLESVTSVELAAGAVLGAAGGGGGEGGQGNAFGSPGQDGPYPAGTAMGGFGTNGGNGGNGGTADGLTAALAGPGLPGPSPDSSGGGGGAAGRVFLGTRPPAAPVVAGSIAALRTDFNF